jgi:hypothetical protein
VTPQHTGGTGYLLGKFLDQHTLADASFAAHERNLASARPCLMQSSRQFPELSLAFQEVHSGFGRSIRQYVARTSNYH